VSDLVEFSSSGSILIVNLIVPKVYLFVIILCVVVVNWNTEVIRLHTSTHLVILLAILYLHLLLWRHVLCAVLEFILE
jgi:membrane protein implicated in regulation of membrane protease activity